MKYLIMCEEPNELEVIKILLKHDCLKFKSDDLLGLVRTKPELEMLLIISEGLTKEFEKVKSKERAKTFAKEKVMLGRRAYKNDTDFYAEYYGADPQRLVDSIREYRRIKGAHEKDEHYLAELLKKY